MTELEQAREKAVKVFEAFYEVLINDAPEYCEAKEAEIANASSVEELKEIILDVWVSKAPALIDAMFFDWNV